MGPQGGALRRPSPTIQHLLLLRSLPMQTRCQLLRLSQLLLLLLGKNEVGLLLLLLYLNKLNGETGAGIPPAAAAAAAAVAPLHAPEIFGAAVIVLAAAVGAACVVCCCCCSVACGQPPGCALPGGLSQHGLQPLQEQQHKRRGRCRC